MQIFDSDNHEKFSISSIEKRNLKCKNRTRLYVMTDSSRHVRRETADEREQSPLNTEFVVQWLRPIIIDAYLFRTLTHLISFPSGEFCDVCQQKNLGILLFFERDVALWQPKNVTKLINTRLYCVSWRLSQYSRSLQITLNRLRTLLSLSNKLRTRLDDWRGCFYRSLARHSCLASRYGGWSWGWNKLQKSSQTDTPTELAQNFSCLPMHHYRYRQVSIFKSL